MLMTRKILGRVAQVWRFGLRPGSPVAFAFALLCVAVATIVQLLGDLIRPDILIHATYYPAILLATLVGGAWAGSLALVLGGLVAWWAFEPPYFTFAPPSVDHAIDLMFYVMSSMVIVWTAEKYRRVLRRLEAEEHYRRLVVDELGHRVKNKLATVYAILSYELRGQREVWDKIDGRLRALAATDDFVAKSNGDTAGIIDILRAELTPYDVSRVALKGEPIRLPAKLAVTLALIFHELATNSAKYGALSVSGGRIGVSWSHAAGRMAIDWTESGGPAARAPLRSGFGKRLLERGLDPFHGSVTAKYGPNGYSCRIALALPGEDGHEALPPQPQARAAPAECGRQEWKPACGEQPNKVA